MTGGGAGYEALRFWLEVAQMLATGVLGLYVWISNKSRVNTERIERLENAIDARLDTHVERLVKVESAVRFGPSHQDLTHIHQRMDETAAAMNSLAGEFRAVRGTLDLIHQYLLNEGTRK
jgi:hypothetical protein